LLLDLATPLGETEIEQDHRFAVNMDVARGQVAMHEPGGVEFAHQGPEALAEDSALGRPFGQNVPKPLPSHPGDAQGGLGKVDIDDGGRGHPGCAHFREDLGLKARALFADALVELGMSVRLCKPPFGDDGAAKELLGHDLRFGAAVEDLVHIHTAWTWSVR
jgi:hypothetical protein